MKVLRRAENLKRKPRDTGRRVLAPHQGPVFSLPLYWSIVYSGHLRAETDQLHREMSDHSCLHSRFKGQSE
jgi:hypothetical protein